MESRPLGSLSQSNLLQPIVGPVALFLSGLFLSMAALYYVHDFQSEPFWLAPLFVLAAFFTLAFAFVAFLRPLSPPAAQRSIIGMSFLAWALMTAQLLTSIGMLHAMNLILLQVAAATFLAKRRWAIVFILLSWSSFGALLFLTVQGGANRVAGGTESEVLSRFGYAMAGGTALSLLILYALTQKMKQGHLIMGERARLEAENTRMRSLVEVTGGVAHELNTPLGTLEMLVGQAALEPALRAKFEAAVARIAHTSRALGVFAEGLTTTSPPGRVGLSGWLAPIVEREREGLEIRGITIKGPGALRGDAYFRPDEAEVAATGLIQNAVEAVSALEPADPERWVALELAETPAHWDLRVSNGGPKISDAVRGRLFQPFFTTKGKSNEHRGLSLSVARGLMRGHGCDVLYDPTARHTCFVLRLPKHAPRTEVAKS